MPALRIAAKASTVLSLVALAVAGLTACGESFRESSADASAVDPDAATTTSFGNGDDAAALQSDDSGPVEPTPDAAPVAVADAGQPVTSCTSCARACCPDATQVCAGVDHGCQQTPDPRATTGNLCALAYQAAACIAGDVCAPISTNAGICATTCSTNIDCMATKETCAPYPRAGSICTCNQMDVCDVGEMCTGMGKGSKCH